MASTVTPEKYHGYEQLVYKIDHGSPGELIRIACKETYDWLVQYYRNRAVPPVKFRYDPLNMQDSEFKKAAVPINKPLLHRAEDLINGARQQEYGDKLRNFDQIADFWNAHLKYKLAPGCKVTAEDVALMMIGVKQARLAKTPTHEDSVLDIAGYIGCYDKILEERRTSNAEVTTHPLQRPIY